jgi:glycosyltransferase involved in cell wall biosynthesis
LSSAVDAWAINGPEVRVLRIIARLNIGGPAYHVSLLSGALDPDRYQTLLLAGSVAQSEGSFDGLPARYGATCRHVPGLQPDIAPLADLRALVSLGRAIRRYRPDIVHTHTAKAGTLGRLAAILAPGARPLVVHTFHGHVLTGYFGPAKSAMFARIERALALRSDCLIGVSAATVDELVAMRVAPRDKFRVVPIGLDLDPFLTVDRAAGAAFRREVEASDDDVLAVSVGRLVPIKRLDVLIDAVALARAGGVPMRLAVVGDGDMRPELERRAADAGIADAVRFTGFRSDLPAIAAAADVAVLTSDNEGTPVALIEAAAAARPAVATDVGGVRDIVTPQTGLVVPPGDAAAVARALGQIAGDRDARERMGGAARRHVAANYSAARLVRDMTALYDELCAQRVN